MRAIGRLFLLALCSCRAHEPGNADTAGSSSTADDSPSTTTSHASTTEAAASSTSSADTTADSTTTATGESSDTSTGASSCSKRVVVMGYWPPTNEMLRRWSPNPAQNPDGWIGENWHGHGYDVFAFFPEFPPDGDPTNDEIGEDGSVGSPEFDLRVDYQATSADFWRIVDELAPTILVTTSRGGQTGWEIEAREGGHGAGNPGDPSLDWSSDAHGEEVYPTEASIEPRSWDAIATHRQGATLATTLPVQPIFDATSALGLTDVAVDDNTSGTYLSGFLALHGLYYELHTPHAVAGGHIHVGFALPVEDARVLIETTLEAIVLAHPADSVACP